MRKVLFLKNANRRLFLEVVVVCATPRFLLCFCRIYRLLLLLFAFDLFSSNLLLKVLFAHLYSSFSVRLKIIAFYSGLISICYHLFLGLSHSQSHWVDFIFYTDKTDKIECCFIPCMHTKANLDIANGFNFVLINCLTCVLIV